MVYIDLNKESPENRVELRMISRQIADGWRSIAATCIMVMMYWIAILFAPALVIPFGVTAVGILCLATFEFSRALWRLKKIKPSLVAHRVKWTITEVPIDNTLVPPPWYRVTYTYRRMKDHGEL